MPKHRRHATILFGLLAVAPIASAFQPLITDDTGTQGTAGNQIEFAWNFDRAEVAGDTTRIRTLPLALTRGLTDTLDVFFQASHLSIRSTLPGVDADGSGNPSFGAKWRFYDNAESKTSLGFKPEIRLPVSAAKEAVGLGTGRTSYSATLVLTQEVSFGAIHANLVAGRFHFRDAAIPDVATTRASVAPVWDVAEKWQLAVDVGTETASAGGVRLRIGFVEAGAIYSPNDDLDFALGVIRSSADDNPRTTTTSATLGVTWRFK